MSIAEAIFIAVLTVAILAVFGYGLYRIFSR